MRKPLRANDTVFGLCDLMQRSNASKHSKTLPSSIHRKHFAEQ